MRPTAFAVAALLVLAPLSPAQERPGVRHRDAFSVPAPAEASPRDAAIALVERLAPSLLAGGATSLGEPGERASLTGRHFHFPQTIDGIPVLNGGVSISIHSDGTASVHDRTARASLGALQVDEGEAKLAAAEAARSLRAVDIEGVALVAWVGEDGQARAYQRVVLSDGLRRHAAFVDAESGCVSWIEPLFHTARGRVFDSNPVTSTNDASLLDGDDAASSVPERAYVAVELPGLSGSGPLAGPYASIVDTEIPTTTPALQPASLELTRDRDEFEEVNAYFQVDRAQRYLRSLGFTDERTIVGYPIEIDTHAGGGEDDSSYRFTSPGQGRLFFGDGGVDDAEDADIVLHEFAHAIQDSIVPTGFTGPAPSEARALGEGFADYWAFSSFWNAARSSGRDPFCIGDWDARCSPGPSTRCGYDPGSDCLRRVDGTKTMHDYVRSGGSGTEHRNGEIWSSALREIFLESIVVFGVIEGKRVFDRTVLESFFGVPPNPSFRTATLRLIDADRRLNGGALTGSICRAMTDRGIVYASDCDLGLSGDLTLVASATRDLAIPDNDQKGIASSLVVSDGRVAEELFVRVDVVHPRRGDLRLTLLAPDGQSVVLQVENGDSGSNIKAVYGLDAEPSQPLSPLAGRSAAGTWTLRVTDTFGGDAGRLVSWGLMFRFAGDDPVTVRSRAGADSIFLPVAGSVESPFGTGFSSDVRIANTGAETSHATLFFTPSGFDGSVSFSALRLQIAPGATLALDDLLEALLHQAGTGAIEIRGDTGELVVTSRIYDDTGSGTHGQFVRAGTSAVGPSPDEVLHVLHLSNGPAFRSNLGVTEVGGESGKVKVRLLDAGGVEIRTEEVELRPFEHVQFSLLNGPAGVQIEALRAEVSVVAGLARILAYGSVIDNASGDAIFVPGSHFASTSEPRPVSLVVPAVIRAPGANGTFWRSDLRLLNRSTTATRQVTLKFFPASGVGAETVEVPIAPGATEVIDDVLGERFAKETARGSIEIASSGGDTLSELVVTSRTWTPGAEGSFGQFVPAIPAIDGSSRAAGPVSLVHVDLNESFRCNVGLTETDGKEAVVRVRLLDASGSERFRDDVRLPARGNVQFNLGAAGAPSVSNGRLLVEVVEGDGRVLPYASVVDNTSGDPIFVSR